MGEGAVEGSSWAAVRDGEEEGAFLFLFLCFDFVFSNLGVNQNPKFLVKIGKVV